MDCRLRSLNFLLNLLQTPINPPHLPNSRCVGAKDLDHSSPGAILRGGSRNFQHAHHFCGLKAVFCWMY
ncbi:Hypothetical predicted protein [Cloeon dipterum]|uniref:Uncharacterized protein n=1 Tax=Cloeon dipterum TaxID=197152 RepID=A0A8S1CVJ2_9INSE|nr:Hypothetical predicted protein [Cloeon dipterum]